MDFFDMFYMLNDADIQKLAKQLNMPFEEVKRRVNGVSVGSVYGHAHTTTVVPLLERLFYSMNCKSVTLKIDLEHADDPDACDGHLSIEVTALERLPCQP
jgi:hypothetical protein